MAKPKIYALNVRGKRVLIRANSWSQIAKWNGCCVATARKWGSLTNHDACDPDSVVDLDLTA